MKTRREWERIKGNPMGSLGENSQTSYENGHDYGDGDGNGYGNGDGNGYGDGDGNGDGNGYGNGGGL